ncbi:hypothetical protein [Hymenobacter sp. BT730]|uniref:hypothetical protein n=1 Tax=Hymenobacter sp. BT730 TaxID=3063332 RepID=UPI0026DEFFBE|nr:hypothetical protein [Hymenobacter sp. BT730]
MRLLYITLFILLLFNNRSVQALTYNEPWHEQVVKNADFFVLAKVISSDPDKGLTANIIRSLDGSNLSGIITINNFYQLDICSSSGGHGPEFHFEKTDTCYFFLKKNAAGVYSIATPTSGFAPVANKNVRATYRHSYHQASVPQSVYEPTMTAIFRKYHGQDFDTAYINDFIKKSLALAPAKIDEEGMSTFFLQHVALETMFHLGLTSNYALVLPFLHDTSNFHAQLSAARALTGINTPESKQQLLAMLNDKATGDFPKTVAVWTLASYNPKDLKKDLEKLLKRASKEETGFGGNFMDPRICTSVPTVKEALTKLTAQL